MLGRAVLAAQRRAATAHRLTAVGGHRASPAAAAAGGQLRRAVTKAQIAEVREISGAGLLDCKKAVEAAAGDIDKALDWLQERGIAKADKKRNRAAAAGAVMVAPADAGTAVVEINSETDFVARAAPFAELITIVASAAPRLLDGADCADEAAAAELIAGDAAVAQQATKCIAQMGENVRVRRARWFPRPAGGAVGTYLHNRIKGSAAGATAAAVALRAEGEDTDREEMQLTADRLAQHIVAESLSGEDTPLLEQKFMQSEKTVKGWLKGRAKAARAKNITVDSSVLWRCGEGISASGPSFAEEVAKMAQQGVN
eukprot:TRINITY_DN60783_c0_g1_i1.p1 TRINITY_DN60783_c0_g1~~TRINITY_DN60783_c0_g1_i1.p1  ORF type:complete len:339 (+),score=114.75 TRINITY_DN60783_c0_g1_i1:78-1019(+)